MITYNKTIQWSHTIYIIVIVADKTKAEVYGWNKIIEQVNKLEK